MNQVANDWVSGQLNTTNENLKIMDEQFKFMRYGNYTVKMTYQLPDGNLGTSANYDFKNPNKFRI